MNNFLKTIVLPAVFIGIYVPITLAQTTTTTEESPLDSISTPIEETDIPTVETINNEITSSFRFVHKFIIDDGAAGDLFGYGVAMENENILISATYSDNNDRIDNGAVYLFDFDRKLLKNKITLNNDLVVEADNKEEKNEKIDVNLVNNLFGYAMAVKDGYALIAAPYNDEKAINAGSAYLFDLSTGEQKQQFSADDIAAGDLFGYDVATDGKYALISAPYSDDRTITPSEETQKQKKDEYAQKGTDRGAVYLFDLMSGEQLNKLVAKDLFDGDLFGYAVATDGKYALISSPYSDRPSSDEETEPEIDVGAVYLFDLTTGEQVHKFVPNDAKGGDVFGLAVVIQGNYALINAIYSDNQGTNSGAAYLFDITTGQQIRKFLPDDGAEGDLFGFSLAMNDKYVLIGSPYQDSQEANQESEEEDKKDKDKKSTEGVDRGAAYLFDLNSGEQLQKFAPEDLQTGDVFGYSVAMNDKYILIGSTYADDGEEVDQGSVYLFELSTSQ